jgi:hypothetical protein
MQDAEPMTGFEDIDWDRTTERLSDAERTRRYEAHVARLSEIPKEPSKAAADAS